MHTNCEGVPIVTDPPIAEVCDNDDGDEVGNEFNDDTDSCGILASTSAAEPKINDVEQLFNRNKERI
jgi:hypothetical protein